MSQCTDDCLQGIAVLAIQDTASMQCPHGMNDFGIQSDLVHRLVIDGFDQCLNTVEPILFNDQSLSLSTPQEVADPQFRDQLLRRCFTQISGTRHHGRRITFSFRLKCGWLGGLFSPFDTLSSVDKPIDTPVFLIPQFGFVGVPLASLETGGCRVVLDDEVVPVDDPDVSVRTDFSHDWPRPFIVAGQQIPRILRAEAGSVFADFESRDQMACRLCHECGSIPVFLGVGASCVQRVTGCCREATMVIDLPNLVVVQWDELVAVCDSSQNTRRPSPNGFIVTIRNRHEFGGISVCS